MALRQRGREPGEVGQVDDGAPGAETGGRGAASASLIALSAGLQAAVSDTCCVALECSAPDADASGPLHRATVAAMAHRTPAAITRPRWFLMGSTLSPKCVQRIRGPVKSSPKIPPPSPVSSAGDPVRPYLSAWVPTLRSRYGTSVSPLGSRAARGPLAEHVELDLVGPAADPGARAGQADRLQVTAQGGRPGPSSSPVPRRRSGRTGHATAGRFASRRELGDGAVGTGQPARRQPRCGAWSNR